MKLWKELEVGLGCGSKFRVTTHMIMNHRETFTKYALVKATGLKTATVKKQLESLLDLDWIKKYPFEPVVYQANLDNEVVKHIRDFLQKLKPIRRYQNAR